MEVLLHADLNLARFQGKFDKVRAAIERGNGRSLGGPGDAYRKLLQLAALPAQPAPPQVGRWNY